MGNSHFQKEYQIGSSWGHYMGPFGGSNVDAYFVWVVLRDSPS